MELKSEKRIILGEMTHVSWLQRMMSLSPTSYVKLGNVTVHKPWNSFLYWKKCYLWTSKVESIEFKYKDTKNHVFKFSDGDELKKKPSTEINMACTKEMSKYIRVNNRSSICHCQSACQYGHVFVPFFSQNPTDPTILGVSTLEYYDGENLFARNWSEEKRPL